jgi:hypothetical protein
MQEKFFTTLDQNLKKKKFEHGAEIILQEAKIILDHPWKKRIAENNFEDKFGKEVIERDLALVSRLKDKFATQIEHLGQADIERINVGEKFSEILEVIISDEGERYGWIGENNVLRRTSEFDDIFNGVDVILEFKPEEELSSEGQPVTKKMALGVDASRNNDFHALTAKINRNVAKLTDQNNPKLNEVKYFQSAFNINEKGRLKPIIPVVIGLDRKHLSELVSVCALLRSLPHSQMGEAYDKSGVKAGDLQKELSERLKKHPAQAVFCKEIELQLMYYLKVFQNKTYPRAEKYKDEIRSILKKIKKIKESKADIFLGDYGNDEILQIIEGVIAKSETNA